MIEVEKVAGMVTSSAEALWYENYVGGATPEDRARRAVARAAQERAMRGFRDALAKIADPVARAVLDLHATSHAREECDGCDLGTYAQDLPDWPCRTVLLIADRYGLDVP
jgi:hypothetical protein